AVERRGPSDAAGPPTGEREDPEDRTAPQPEAETAPVASERRCDADPAPAAAREQIDRRCEERQQRPDKDELDRPAAHDPAAEVDIARRARCEGDALLHRVDHVLRGTPDLLEPHGLESGRVVAEAVRRPI